MATGLGVSDASLMVYGLTLLVPVWGFGVWWANFHSDIAKHSNQDEIVAANNRDLLFGLVPFAVLAALLLVGEWVDFTALPLFDFLTRPKGALLIAAVLGLLSVPSFQRRECLDEAVRRTGSLLFLIGAASAFGGVFTLAVPFGDFIPVQAGWLGIVALFVLTATFKLVQGSSMATFAAIAPVAAPLVAASNLPPSSAVFAICLGSFVAILPNDSFYWLVRKDALMAGHEIRTIAFLAGGATLQAFAGLAVLLALTAVGFMK